MLRRILVIAIIGNAVSFIGCKDDDDDKEENAPVTNTCTTGNFCMVYDGAQKSGNATFKALANGRNRIYWEYGSTSSFEQVELDFYGSTLGDYTVDTTGAVGTANIEYYSASSGVAEVVTGKVTITAFDPSGSGVSGTFSGTTDNGKVISDGKFSNVKP